MNYDFYVAADSPVHRMDPRVKLAITVSCCVIAFIVNNIWAVLVLLGFLHALYLIGKIPLKKIGMVWKMMLPVNIMIILLWPVFSQEGSMALFTVLGRSVTVESIVRGVFMAARITCLGMACFVLLFTTDQSTIVLGLVRLGLPYDWGLTFAITLRYLPTFYGIISMIIDAQKARGLDLEKGRFFSRLKAYLPILVSVIITGLKASANLGNALETRAFGATVGKRTYYRDLQMRHQDYTVLAAIILGTVGLTFVRFQFGFAGDLMHLMPLQA